jgi:hypothetical protein
MSCIDCDKIIEEILLHEIVGFETTAGGGGDIIVEDDDVLVASGINTLNFAEGIKAVNAGGQIDVSLYELQVDQGLLWVYDTVRGKWLSTQRSTFGAGEKGRIRNKYLMVFDGQVSNLTGWRVVRDATITAIAAQTRNNETWTLRVRKNGDPTDIASLTMSAVDGNHSSVANVDVSEGDQIQFYAETTGFLGIKDALVWVEVAWRNTTLAAP